MKKQELSMLKEYKKKIIEGLPKQGLANNRELIQNLKNFSESSSEKTLFIEIPDKKIEDFGNLKKQFLFDMKDASDMSMFKSRDVVILKGKKHIVDIQDQDVHNILSSQILTFSQIEYMKMSVQSIIERGYNISSQVNEAFFYKLYKLTKGRKLPPNIKNIKGSHIGYSSQDILKLDGNYSVGNSKRISDYFSKLGLYRSDIRNIDEPYCKQKNQSILISFQDYKPGSIIIFAERDTLYTAGYIRNQIVVFKDQICIQSRFCWIMKEVIPGVHYYYDYGKERSENEKRS